MKSKKVEKKAFDKHSCELKNEEECEDELGDEEISLEKAEEDEFASDEE
jgi:hypothetical protein